MLKTEHESKTPMDSICCQNDTAKPNLQELKNDQENNISFISHTQGCRK